MKNQQKQIKQEKQVIRLIFYPFEELNIQTDKVTAVDLFTLKLQTFEGKNYNMIFKKRISYGNTNEYTLFEINEDQDAI